MITKDGILVEYAFASDCEHEAHALGKLPLEMPAESEVFGDSAYDNYQIEDQLMGANQIVLKVTSKIECNKKRQRKRCLN